MAIGERHDPRFARSAETLERPSVFDKVRMEIAQ
jgi:hypothetical protein